MCSDQIRAGQSAKGTEPEDLSSVEVPLIFLLVLAKSAQMFRMSAVAKALLAEQLVRFRWSWT